MQRSYTIKNCPKSVPTDPVTLHGHTNTYGTENSGGHSIHFVLSQFKETWNKNEVKQNCCSLLNARDAQSVARQPIRPCGQFYSPWLFCIVSYSYFEQ